MTAQLRPLDPPHKGLRNALAQFSLQLGTTEFTDPQSVAALQSLGQEVFLLLEDHARTEDIHVLEPLEERVPGAARVDLDAHASLEARVVELRSQLAAFDGTQSNESGHAYLLEFTDFHADYLKHMLAEERQTETLVRQNFTDEELMADQVAISQEMSFPVLLLWFKYIAPARRVPENVQVLSGFKAAAPPEAYEAVLQQLKQALPAEAYEAVLRQLGG